MILATKVTGVIFFPPRLKVRLSRHSSPQTALSIAQVPTQLPQVSSDAHVVTAAYLTEIANGGSL